LDVIKLPVPDDWCVVLVRPNVRIETKKARAILPQQWDLWTRQMANTAALIHAFATADGALARRALEDLYAEPRRAPLIQHFDEIKRAALDAGAFGCSISGSGRTVFALADHASAERIAAARTIGDWEERGAAIARRGCGGGVPVDPQPQRVARRVRRASGAARDRLHPRRQDRRRQAGADARLRRARPRRAGRLRRRHAPGARRVEALRHLPGQLD